FGQRVGYPDPAGVERHPRRRGNVLEPFQRMRDRALSSDLEQALAGYAMEPREKQRNAACAAIEVRPERAMHHAPGVVDELHGIANRVAALTGPQRVATEPPAEGGCGLQERLVLGRRHPAGPSANS